MKSKRTFIIGAFFLALPSVMQNIVTNLAGLVDNLMVGGLQEHAIAGVMITNQVVFICNLAIFGVIGTAGIFITQYNGIGDEKKVTEVFKISLLFSLAFGIIFFLIMSFVPEFILSFLAEDPDAITEARSYLRFIQYTLLILPVTLAIASAYRFYGFVKIPMYLAMMTVAISTFLNFGLIQGNFGMSALGVEGAALGTLIARGIELVISLGLIIWIKSPITIHFRSFFKLEASMLRVFILKGYGLVINDLIWGLGFQALTVIYTMQITENIAAMSIWSTFANLIWVGVGGLSVVFSIYLGENLGRGDFDKALSDAKILKKLSFFVGITLGVLVFILSIFLARFYEVTPEIMRTGQTLLLITVGVSWLIYLNTSYFAILRAGGDTKSVFILDSLFTWAVMIPVALITGRFGLPLPLRFFLVQLSEVIKLGVAHWLYRKGTWLKNLTSESNEDTAPCIPSCC